MMEEVLVGKIARFVTAHKNLFITLGIILVALLLVRAFLQNNVIVLLDVDSKIKTGEVIVYGSTDAELTEIGKPGLLILNKNIKSLVITKGEFVKTQTDLKAPWYGILSKKVELKNDRNADKVAYRSAIGAQCATYGPESQKLIYYQCNAPSTFVRYTTPEGKAWTVETVADAFFVNREAIPYREGVIGISGAGEMHTGSSKEITYIDEKGQVTELDAPSKYTPQQLASAHIYTDSADPNNDRFVFVDESGAMYLGDPGENGSVQYKTIAAPKKYKVGYNQTLCSIAGTAVNCYIGRSPVGDIDVVESAKNTADYSIISASFSNSDISEKKVNIKSLAFPVDRFITAKNKLYAKSHNELVAFDEAGDSYSVRELAQDARYIEGGDTLRYIQQSGVFEYDDTKRESYQRFYSPNVEPLSIHTVAGKIFVIGSTPNEPAVTYAYQLNEVENTGAARIIDMLPEPIDGAYSTDLVGNRLSVTLDNVFNRVDTRLLVDQNKVKEARESIINNLESKGIRTDSLSIEFKY